MNITYHINDIKEVAQKVIAHSSNKVFIFNASMGAGKTTLITALCKELGVTDQLSSPTFSIVNEYKVKDTTVYHFDLYRIENEEELYHIGIDDYINSNGFLFIEWPDLILDHLGAHTIINIEIVDETHRSLTISY